MTSALPVSDRAGQCIPWAALLFPRHSAGGLRYRHALWVIISYNVTIRDGKRSRLRAGIQFTRAEALAAPEANHAVAGAFGKRTLQTRGRQPGDLLTCAGPALDMQAVY